MRNPSPKEYTLNAKTRVYQITINVRSVSIMSCSTFLLDCRAGCIGEGNGEAPGVVRRRTPAASGGGAGSALGALAPAPSSSPGVFSSPSSLVWGNASSRFAAASVPAPATVAAAAAAAALPPSPPAPVPAAKDSRCCTSNARCAVVSSTRCTVPIAL